MPPRMMTAAIIVFWLAMTGWLIKREVLPAFRTSGPAPFTVNLKREAKESTVFWDVFWNGQTVGQAMTNVTVRPKTDEYGVETFMNLRDFHYESPYVRAGIQLNYIRNNKVVRANGQLVESRGEVGGAIEIAGARADGRVEWQGIVDNNGLFQPHWIIHLRHFGRHELATEPVRIPNQYSTLNPLEPWSRLYHLVPGQTWRMTRFDPLAESIMAVAGVSEPDSLEAGVLENPEELIWNGASTMCLVIEYRGKNEVARTFVRESDGLVIRQEMKTTVPGETDPAKATQLFALQRKEKPRR